MSSLFLFVVNLMLISFLVKLKFFNLSSTQCHIYQNPGYQTSGYPFIFLVRPKKKYIVCLKSHGWLEK